MNYLLLLTSLLIGLTAKAALGAEAAPSAQDVLHQAVIATESVSFTAIANTRLYRANSSEPLEVSAKVHSAGKGDYTLDLTAPTQLEGIIFIMKAKAGQLTLPALKEIHSGFFTRLPENFLIIQLAGKESLIRQNYALKLIKGTLPEDAGYQILDLLPKNTFQDSRKTMSALVPRRRLWIDPATHLPIKAAFFWDWLKPDKSWQYNPKPYAELNYRSLRLAPGAPLTEPGIPRDYQLLKQTSTQSTYADPAAAKRGENESIVLPEHIPMGFVLQDIELLRIKGKMIQAFNYTDGLAQLTLIRLTQSDLASFAGADKALYDTFEKLSYFTPLNIYHLSHQEDVVIAMGELHPDELESTLESFFVIH